jgi:uncharacterized membrane protein (UPF0127 family)
MPKEKTEKTKSALNLLCAALIVVTLLVTVFVYRPKDCLGGYRDDMTIRAGSYSLIAERADTDQSRQTGLSGRKCIPEKTGMLFVFDKADLHGIWMKDMNFPIDILWIDSTKKIIHIEENVDPNTYPKVSYPPTPASYVLEVASGEVESAGLKLSDQLSW